MCASLKKAYRLSLFNTHALCKLCLQVPRVHVSNRLSFAVWYFYCSKAISSGLVSCTRVQLLAMGAANKKAAICGWSTISNGFINCFSWVRFSKREQLAKKRQRSRNTDYLFVILPLLHSNIHTHKSTSEEGDRFHLKQHSDRKA